MSVTLSLVGRTNVGKSTLFNYLTHTKAALIGDISGVTRDRRYGTIQYNDQVLKIIDTGGLDAVGDILSPFVKQQARYAIEEANYIGFVLDGRSGLVYQDEHIVHFLRSFNKPILGIINKVEGHVLETTAITEFTPLGIALYPVSALQGKGFLPLLKAVAFLPQEVTRRPAIYKARIEAGTMPLKITVIGRPNVGKSTLVNRLLGKNRQIISHEAGTTRDSIEIDFYNQGHRYTLVDTAGIRRFSKITNALELASIKQSLAALQDGIVMILLIDVEQGLTDQDLRLLHRMVEAGRAVVILCNKWDTLNAEEKLAFQRECKRRLRFIAFAPIDFISSLQATGLSRILPLVRKAYENATKRLSTSQLTQLLQRALYEYAPPRHVKLRYAHPGGYNPPIIIIHGARVQAVTANYKRYLHNFYQKELKMVGTPLQIEFREKRKN